MIAYAILGLFVGTALGLRFRAYILVPATFLAFTGIAASAIVLDTHFWWPVLAIIGALDLGYVGASLLRVLRAQQRAESLRPAPVSISKIA